MRAHIQEHTYESTGEENRFQSREVHFVQACAGETHMGMLQEPFCVNIYKKNAGPQAHKSHFVWKFTGKMPDRYSGDIVLCELAQAKRTWTVQEGNFVQ